MAVGKQQPTTGGVFFCTFVCWDHLPLIERTTLYDSIYEKLGRWVQKGCSVTGYVILPNHVHILLYVPPGLSVNAVLGNCKRWWAKVIIDRLKEAHDQGYLFRLQHDVDTWRYTKKNQLFRVWETSSDIKHCFSLPMLTQKLDYIHMNPLRGKWRLAERPEEYPHSSASFYAEGRTGPLPLVHWLEIPMKK